MLRAKRQYFKPAKVSFRVPRRNTVLPGEKQKSNFLFSSIFFLAISFKGQNLLKPHPDWSPLGVKFKISDEHTRLFHMGIHCVHPDEENLKCFIWLCTRPLDNQFSSVLYIFGEVNPPLSCFAVCSSFFEKLFWSWSPLHISLTLTLDPFTYRLWTVRPRLYGEKLFRVKRSPSNPSYPGWVNLSYISLQNLMNRLHGKQKVGSARRVTLLAGPLSFSMARSPSSPGQLFSV